MAPRSAIPLSLSRRFGVAAATLARSGRVTAQPFRLTLHQGSELGHLSRCFSRLPAARGREFLQDVVQRTAALLPQQSQELPRLIPALLHSGEPPKGFESFFPKGEQGPKATPGAAAKEAPKAETKSDAAKEAPKAETKSDGGGGGGDKGDGGNRWKKGGDGEGPQWDPQTMPQIIATLVLSAVLLMMMGGRCGPALCTDCPPAVPRDSPASLAPRDPDTSDIQRPNPPEPGGGVPPTIFRYHFLPLCSTMFYYVPLSSSPTMFYYVLLCSAIFRHPTDRAERAGAGRGRSDGREINFQEFLNSLLVDGRVDHLQALRPPPPPPPPAAT